MSHILFVGGWALPKTSALLQCNMTYMQRSETIVKRYGTGDFRLVPAELHRSPDTRKLISATDVN